jgi:hypothetical protein
VKKLSPRKTQITLKVMKIFFMCQMYLETKVVFGNFSFCGSVKKCIVNNVSNAKNNKGFFASLAFLADK